MVDGIGAWLLDGLFPQYCALCGLRSGRGVPLCLPCEREMPLNRCCCVRCAIPLPAIAHASADPGRRAVANATDAGGRLCGSCLGAPPPFARVVAPWLYGEYLGHLIQLWKYQRQRRLTPLLAQLLLQQGDLSTPIDLLLPVPLHWRRQWRRGFNQSELLARQLLATCPELKGCQLADRLVRRCRPTAAQSGMNARQRAVNLRGAFTVRGPCDNLRVAIVDDVLTTGATAAAMAETLTAAGAVHVEVWCLARTPAPGS